MGSGKRVTGRSPHPEGFTLIELLISVAILSIGLVGIIGGFIGSLNALQRAESRFCALEVLEAKIWELEEQARKEGGIETGEFEGDNWALEVTPVEPEEDLDLSEDLSEVELRVWSNTGREGEKVALVTLMRNNTDYTDEEC